MAPQCCLVSRCHWRAGRKPPRLAPQPQGLDLKLTEPRRAILRSPMVQRCPFCLLLCCPFFCRCLGQPMPEIACLQMASSRANIANHCLDTTQLLSVCWHCLPLPQCIGVGIQMTQATTDNLSLSLQTNHFLSGQTYSELIESITAVLRKGEKEEEEEVSILKKRNKSRTTKLANGPLCRL